MINHLNSNHCDINGTKQNRHSILSNAPAFSNVKFRNLFSDLSPPPKEILHFDAIVLGAGIAGLGAGRVLKEANMNFVILEGSNRIGGRINTVPMTNLINNDSEEVLVDTGAQWLHGKNNELYEFADKFNLLRPELSIEGEGDFMRDDGKTFDDFFVKKVDFFVGQILEECEEFVERKDNESFRYPSSIEEFVEKRFKKFVDDLETDSEKSQALQLLDWHRKFVSWQLAAKRIDLESV